MRLFEFSVDNSLLGGALRMQAQMGVFAIDCAARMSDVIHE